MSADRLKTARVALFDAAGRILLARCVDPSGVSVWITPGGSIEDGELPAETARRELWEEAGIADATLGPLFWIRENPFDWSDDSYVADERVFVARVRDRQSEARPGGATVEGEMVAEVKWWSAAELDSTREPVSPAALADLVRLLLRDGPPSTPFEIDGQGAIVRGATSP